MDNDQENIQKYAIDSACHDLGIWTDKTFDYLEPSINQEKKYLIETHKEHCTEEIALMIDMHHKRRAYKGDFEKSVETFRRADGIVVTKGRMPFHVSKDDINKINEDYPLFGIS